MMVFSLPVFTVLCISRVSSRTVLLLGGGTVLAEMDIQDAYRNIPVHPEDTHVGGYWGRPGKRECLWTLWSLLVSTLLLRCSMLFSDAMELILKKGGVRELCHYLNDFLVFDDPESSESSENAQNLSALVQWTNWLGFPLALVRIEGPSTTLTFLESRSTLTLLFFGCPKRTLLPCGIWFVSWTDC